jgi:hypothetical protein
MAMSDCNDGAGRDDDGADDDDDECNDDEDNDNAIGFFSSSFDAIFFKCCIMISKYNPARNLKSLQQARQHGAPPFASNAAVP